MSASTPTPSPSNDQPALAPDDASREAMLNAPAVVDRRSGLDRRNRPSGESGYTGPERRKADRGEGDGTGLERRRGPGIRREEDRKSAEEGEMKDYQFEFVLAVETYKKVNKRMYPTWTEILEVLYQLGYRKVMAREIQLENAPEPRLWVKDLPPVSDDDETKQAA